MKQSRIPRVLNVVFVVMLLAFLAACTKITPIVTPTEDPENIPQITNVPVSTEQEKHTPGVPDENVTDAPETSAVAEETPIPYNEREFDILRDFFETQDENGIPNGDKCFAAFDADDPKTWAGPIGARNPSVLLWNKNGELTGIYLHPFSENLAGFEGNLSFDGFNKLEIIEIDLSVNELTVKNCSRLRYINRAYSLGEIEIKTDRYFEKLQVSSHTRCHCEQGGEEFAVPEKARFSINAETDGNGIVTVQAINGSDYFQLFVIAEAGEGSSFVGWYDRDGQLISAELRFELSNPIEFGVNGNFDLTARFN